MSKEDKRIRELAHQIWESEGKPDGAHDRHWEICLLYTSPSPRD